MKKFALIALLSAIATATSFANTEENCEIAIKAAQEVKNAEVAAAMEADLAAGKFEDCVAKAVNLQK